MIDAKDIADTAVRLYKEIEGRDAWQKREVISILTVLVELDVQRTVARLTRGAAHKTKAEK